MENTGPSFNRTFERYQDTLTIYGINMAHWLKAISTARV